MSRLFAKGRQQFRRWGSLPGSSFEGGAVFWGGQHGVACIVSAGSCKSPWFAGSGCRQDTRGGGEMPGEGVEGGKSDIWTCACDHYKVGFGRRV